MIHGNFGVESTISMIAESLLNRGHYHDLAVAVHVRLDIDLYSENGPDFNDCSVWTFFFIMPSNYVKVLISRDGSLFFPPQSGESYKCRLGSNHDSCWRSDPYHVLSDYVNMIMDEWSKKGLGEDYVYENIHVNVSIENIKYARVSYDISSGRNEYLGLASLYIHEYIHPGDLVSHMDKRRQFLSNLQLAP